MSLRCPNCNQQTLANRGVNGNGSTSVECVTCGHAFVLTPAPVPPSAGLKKETAVNIPEVKETR